MTDSTVPVMSGTSDGEDGADIDARQRRLLDAAATVFLRYGYRKTSMDDIARAAGVSRQGLYLHFATKEDLFRAAVQYLLDGALAEALSHLSETDRALEEQLVGAFDAWLGRFAGALAGDASDLQAATQDLVAPLIAERERIFVDATAGALQSSGLTVAYEAAGLTAQQLAATLYATGRGFKLGASRQEFVEGMTVAVRAICLPQLELDTRSHGDGAKAGSRAASRDRERPRDD